MGVGCFLVKVVKIFHPRSVEKLVFLSLKHVRLFLKRTSEISFRCYNNKNTCFQEQKKVIKHQRVGVFCWI